MLMSIFSRAFNSLTNVLSSGVRMAASPRLLGRYSGGAGAGQEIRLGEGFSFVGDTLTYTSPGGGATWGAITGTLASQSDLQAALDAKAVIAGGNAFTGSQTMTGSSGPVLDIRRSTVGTNNIAVAGQLTAISSGDVADGFGPILIFRISDTGVSDSIIGGFGFVRAGADNTGDFVVRPQVAGTATERFRVTSAGDLILNGGENAAAGAIGEYLENRRLFSAPLSLTDSIGADLASITLTPGDWNVEGSAVFTDGSATTTIRGAIITTTSASFIPDGTESYAGVTTTAPANATSSARTSKRLRVTVNTPIYLSVLASFSAGTISAYGQISARRVR